MQNYPTGIAIVYCEGAYNTTNGKTAHGLVRFTKRYDVRCVIDSRYAGKDSGLVLDGKENGIPIIAALKDAVKYIRENGEEPTHFVVGLAPDGGRLSEEAEKDVRKALRLGLNVDSGLHDFLTEKRKMRELAAKHNVVIRDIRKPIHRDDLHFFEGKIEKVDCLKVALLGTDSAIGKRTTAWILVQALQDAGYKAQLIGTGQTAWLQGAAYSIIMDTLVNDFVAGEIEHAVYSAWENEKPEVIVIEGQGSLMNPAYPGGFEILAAGRPDVVVLQHAPARKEYDGFPGYPLHPLPKQIEAIELISGKKVVAVTINHENISDDKIADVCAAVEKEVNLPAFDVLKTGGDELAKIILKYKK
ncbi:MAG: DUF1611 domain-containing protein [Ignavibacteriae bacterium]|nr:DUF1611 domain-containing protein [Ignavibacteriota bacterium]NOG98917.1 DUF1611 domain-containing protein [Ignavibacteriota bacterium]